MKCVTLTVTGFVLFWIFRKTVYPMPISPISKIGPTCLPWFGFTYTLLQSGPDRHTSCSPYPMLYTPDHAHNVPFCHTCDICLLPSAYDLPSACGLHSPLLLNLVLLVTWLTAGLLSLGANETICASISSHCSEIVKVRTKSRPVPASSNFRLR